MKFLHGHRIFVDSAGVRAKDIDGYAVAVMDEIGIDLSRHHAKTFDDLQDDYFDIVISLSPEAQHKAIELTRVTASEVEYWPTPDPSVAEGHRDARLAAYRDLWDYLIRRIAQRFGDGAVAAGAGRQE